MRFLRPLFSTATLCLIGGVAGGLALGYLLSQRGAWLTPAPWAIYLILLLVAIGVASWLDERRRLRVAAEAWPLPADFTVDDAEEIPAATPAAAETGVGLGMVRAEAPDSASDGSKKDREPAGLTDELTSAPRDERVETGTRAGGGGVDEG